MRLQVWFVYLMRCCDGSLYCGVTTQVSRRLLQHNGVRPGGAKYTRGRRPVALCAFAPCKDKAEAYRVETKVKSVPRKKKVRVLLELCLSQECVRKEG